MLKGRLGLEKTRIPYVDRHGLMWLSKGRLYVSDGTLHFVTAGSQVLASGDYSIPYQNISMLLIGPGTTLTHDSLRLLARHGTGLVAIGEDGVRFYASMPAGTNDSKYSRNQVRCWSDENGKRQNVIRSLYAFRMGEIFPNKDINVLRGMEGARMKKTYKLLAQRYGIKWSGRHYDRSRPELSDPPNEAINHAATAIEAAAMIAVSATSTIPQLGFIHEDSSNSFVLDIADLFRDKAVLPIAFSAVQKYQKECNKMPLERIVRRIAGETIRKEKIIPKMISKITDLFS